MPPARPLIAPRGLDACSPLPLSIPRSAKSATVSAKLLTVLPKKPSGRFAAVPAGFSLLWWLAPPPPPPPPPLCQLTVLPSSSSLSTAVSSMKERTRRTAARRSSFVM